MITHLVLDGVADGPLGVALDVVSTAARLLAAGVSRATAEGALRQRVVSLDGEPVHSGAGRVVQVDGALSLRKLGPGDTLVLPGLGAATEGQIAALLRRDDTSQAVAALRRAASRGAVVAASCSATFVLGAAGLLDGKHATTTWWLVPSFARRFPKARLCVDRMVVEESGVFTAGAALAHADLMLALLARQQGPTLPHQIARYLILDERPSQSRYAVAQHLRSDDPVVRRLETFVVRHLDRQLSLDEMARAVGASPRTLARRVASALGTTPQRLVQRLRVARATHLIETTDESIDAIAGRVGYADAAAFRRVFRRETGETPLAFRTRR